LFETSSRRSDSTFNRVPERVPEPTCPPSCDSAFRDGYRIGKIWPNVYLPAMKLIPPAPSPNTTSSGERLLFDLLRQSDLPGWVGLHSLSVSEHERKRWGELDFVLLSVDGLLAIEVKGGRVSSHDGVWTYTDRYGMEHESYESPFRQAETGLMGLRKRLEEHLPADRLRSLSLGYGVAFPQTRFDVTSVEWAEETVLDAEHVRNAHRVAKWVRRLAKYWNRRTRTTTPAPEALVKEVLGLLRPEFDRVPSLAYRTNELLTRMERLTEEQYRQLDFIEENPRLLCDGGAGTGKSFLAAELARREAAKEKRVLLTCWSPHLSSFLRSRVPDSVTVRPFDQLDPAADRPFDVLIVDEAQDLMSFEDFQVLDAQVANGLEQGRWAFFLDQNLQSGIRGRMDPDALTLLREFGGVPGHLRWNCRNTEPIMVQTRLVTGADLGKPTAGTGPPVRYAYYSDDADCALQLQRYLSDLTSSDVAPGEITILSPRPFPESSASRLSGKWLRRLVQLEPETAADLPMATTTFARIADFKGLENQFIAVVDIDSFGRADLAHLYVAMSRARAQLWIALHESVQEEISNASASHLDSVLAGERDG
jgi:hypothetical protein